MSNSKGRLDRTVCKDRDKCYFPRLLCAALRSSHLLDHPGSSNTFAGTDTHLGFTVTLMHKSYKTTDSFAVTWRLCVPTKAHQKGFKMKPCHLQRNSSTSREANLLSLSLFASHPGRETTHETQPVLKT